MSHAAQNLHEEYWRPPTVTMQETGVESQAESCARCSTKFAAGARFCHACGAQREARTQLAASTWTRLLEFGRFREVLGLSSGSLVAFIFGAVFVIAAIGTGVIYTANTLLDWQAVQIWRMEWLLAAIVAFLAGILLKRNSG